MLGVERVEVARLGRALWMAIDDLGGVLADMEAKFYIGGKGGHAQCGQRPVDHAWHPEEYHRCCVERFPLPACLLEEIELALGRGIVVLWRVDDPLVAQPRKDSHRLGPPRRRDELLRCYIEAWGGACEEDR